MVALNRLLPHVKVALWLTGWAVALNLMLFTMAATPVLGWLPDRQTGLGFVLDNRQRVEAAVEAYRSREVQPDKFLGAIVGISNMREAVDLEVLSAAVGPKWRFIGVSGAGAGAPSVEEHSALIIESELRPDLVVLGIAPLQLLDTLIRPDVRKVRDAASAPVPLQARAREAVKSSLWPMLRRRDVAVSSERGLLDLRRRLFEAFDVRLETVDTSSPWRAMLRVMGSERYPDEVLRAGVGGAQSLGTFDIGSYRHSRLAPAQIGQTIRGFEERGATVLVVLTPEHSWLRTREPEGIADYIQARLRQTSGNPDLRVLDYRSALPDTGFVDLSHANSNGSRRFSELLGKQLVDLSPDHPPLMSRR